MILEMVFTAIVVIFLISFLVWGQINGGTGVWGGMGQGSTAAEETPEYEMEELTSTILAAPIPKIRCRSGKVHLNQTYELAELFVNETGEQCFLELEDVYLGTKSVLARGDLASLAEEESPAAVLYDTAGGTLMFTRTGSYRALLRVGTAYGWKPCREVWVTIPAVSDYVLEKAPEGGE
jgi:hypothetical protein